MRAGTRLWAPLHSRDGCIQGVAVRLGQRPLRTHGTCVATYRRQRHRRIQALSAPENSSPGSTHFAKPDKRSLIPSEEQSPLTDALY